MSDESTSGATYPPTPSFSSASERSPTLSAVEKLAQSRALPSRSRSKGKERAIDPFDAVHGDDSDPCDHNLAFGVRFTSQGEEDLLELWVDEKDTVREVKRKVRLAWGTTEGGTHTVLCRSAT